MKNGYCRRSSKKYAKMVLFGLKTHFEKIFLGYFYPPTLPMQKNWVKIVPKQVFTGAGFKSPPSRCPFQRPFFVGFIHHANKVQMSIPIFQYCGPNLYNLQSNSSIFIEFLFKAQKNHFLQIIVPFHF